MIDTSSLTEVLKGTSEILKLIYEDALQPSIQSIGRSLGTVFEFAGTALMPLKLHNEIVSMNFKKRMLEYKDKFEQIPEDKRCEVHTHIGVPIIEKLMYTTTDEIADLYTTLLTTASCSDTLNRAHPSFVNMIGQISGDEARIIGYLSTEDCVPYCSYKCMLKDDSGYCLALPAHKTMLNKKIHLSFPENEEVYWANLISLGILKDMSDVYIVDDALYDEINRYHNFDLSEKQLVPSTYKSLTIERSYFQVTELGKLFISACINK